MRRILLCICFLLIAPIVYAPPAHAVNTSLYALKDVVADFNFSAGTGYQLVHQTLFNTTDANSTFVQHVTLNINKLSIGGTNQIYLRTKIDGITIVDELVRTTKDAGEIGSTGTFPEMFNVSAGPHNFTLEVKATGAGGLGVDDIDLTLVQMKATTNNSVIGRITTGVFNHSSANFVSAFNWTINKLLKSPTFTSLKQTITATFTGQNGVTTQYQLKNLNDNHTSPYWARFLQLTNDVGSMGMGWIDDDDNAVAYNQTILSRVTSVNPNANPLVRSNSTFFTMDLRDNETNIINNFQIHNNQTNLSNFIDYNAPGTFNIVNKTVTIRNGSGYFIAMSVSFKSETGTNTPTFFINASNVPQSSCYSKKERYINSANDIANVFIFMICSNLTVGNSYTFNLWIQPPGPNGVIRVFDESLNGFEVEPLASTDAPLPPIPTIITNPANGSCNNGTINITWLAFTDPEGNNITYNVTLLNSTGAFNRTINGSTNLTYQLFDTTTVKDGNWTIVVEGCDTLGLCANTSVNFTIDNTKPSVIPLAPPAGSSFNFGKIIEIAATVTDNCCINTVKANITYPNGGFSLLTLASQPSNKYNASFTIPSINGRYNVTFIANDSCNNINNTETTYFNTINITVEKTGTPHPVDPGAQINYTITVTNNGSGTAYNITVKEYYPSNVTFSNSSPAPTTGNDTWFFPNLTSGSTIEINITVNVSNGLPQGFLLNNTINVIYEDSNGTNTTITHSQQTPISGAVAIVAEKTATPNPVAPGANLTYAITVTNLGNVIAYNVTVTETESSDLTYLNASPQPNSTNPYTWIIPELVEDLSFIINITKQVNGTITNGTTVYNRANITYNNTLIITVNTSTSVSSIPYLTLAKTSSPDPVIAGNELNYTITITNTGGAPALNVVVTESYPGGVAFASSSPNPSSGNDTWSLGTIQNGSSTTINITVTVNASLSGTITNIVNLTFYNDVTVKNESVRTTETTDVTPITPPVTTAGGGGGGSRGGYNVQPAVVCTNGTYYSEGTEKYGPICCDENYCKTLGYKWRCIPVEGKTFSICKLPTETVEPPKITQQPEEKIAETQPREIQKSGFKQTPEKEITPVTAYKKDNSSKFLIAAIAIVILVLGIITYLSLSHYRR